MAGYSKAEAKSFGTRCMRVGGASAAAEFGVKDRLFQKHGRWVTERIKDKYVQEDLDARLEVSRAIFSVLREIGPPRRGKQSRFVDRLRWLGWI